MGKLGAGDCYPFVLKLIIRLDEPDLWRMSQAFSPAKSVFSKVPTRVHPDTSARFPLCGFLWFLHKSYSIKGVFAKNEKGYRLSAIKKRF